MEWTTRMLSALVVGGVVLSLGVTGCGSDSGSGSENKTTSSTSSAAESTSATTQAAPTPEAGKNPTIKSYIDENGITDVAVEQGEPGAPGVELPVPAGWATADAADRPADSYGAIVYTGPDAGDPAPRIIAWYRKLTGNVDPQKILDVAGGELNNLPGWEPTNPGSDTELSGYKGFQLGGTYNDKDGQKQFATQKTIVIPADGAVYVLQLDGMARDSQIDILGPATIAIDDETKITPP